MSATARAEARRKAILARGGDRLAKLTSSAREGSPVYIHDDPPLPNITANFMGEDTSDMPKPRAASSPSSFGPGPPPPPDPSIWSEHQQSQFMNAMNHNPNANANIPQSDPFATMMAAMSQGGPGADGPNPLAALVASMNQQQGPGGFQPPPAAIGGGEDPLAALMASMGAPPQGPGSASSPVSSLPKPKSIMQRLLPLIHLLSVWALLAYFALWAEPSSVDVHGNKRLTSVWSRWGTLKREPGWSSVNFVPFFWAFTALELALHSIRIFSGYDKITPPFLLSMALPHLPPVVRAIIVNGLKYIQMGSILLDDIAGILVATGLLVTIAGFWYAESLI